MLSKTQLSTIYPQADTSVIDAFATAGLQALKSAGILDGVNRLAFFLAQLGHESNGLTVREENLNYSANRLMQVWPSRFPTLDAAKKYENNPEKLANFVYGGRLGNEDDGDGYKYRGRGYIQLTGRDIYRQIGSAVGLDLEANPDLASRPDNAAKIACAYWTSRNINPACDKGDFTAVTKLVNGGTTGMADRQAWLAKVQTVLATTATVPSTPTTSTATTSTSTATISTATSTPTVKPKPATTMPTTAPASATAHADPDDDESPANDAIMMAQTKLHRLGYYSGVINGIYNQLMRSALMEFQRQEGLTPTGRLDGATMSELNV